MSSHRWVGLALAEALAACNTIPAVDESKRLGDAGRTKETTLRTSLAVLREAIDKYHADTGRYPEALEELVARRYIRALPVDPVTESAATWITLPPPGGEKGGVYDVRSGAEGKTAGGTPLGEL